HFSERGDGDFTIVAQSTHGSARTPPFTSHLEAASQRAAQQIHGAKAGPVQQASPDISYVQITTPLENEDAAKRTPDVRDALGSDPGAKLYVSGAPAINHDTQKIYNDDLARGEMI